MTPEQKQIAIAEFEGWKELRDGRWKFAETGIVERFLPLYLTSRDAICVAVGRLDKARSAAFVAKLEDVVFSSKPKPYKEGDCFGYIELPPEDIAAMILATPAQMADALLLTLGFEV